MNEYEKYLEDYKANHRVNMWNDEVVKDLMSEFNLSYTEAFQIRLNWYRNYESKRI